MELNLNEYFYRLLCKRKRRIQFIVHWHTTGSLEYLEQFIETVLYAQTFVLLNEKDSFTIFRNLKIQYNWITPEEQEQIQKYKNCKQPLQFELSRQNRRELIRDLLILGNTRPDIKDVFCIMIIQIIQKFMNKYPNDEFLKSIYYVCKGWITLENLICS